MSDLVTLALLVSTATVVGEAGSPRQEVMPEPPRASKPVPAGAADASPVVIAEGGNMGMAFRFGGLANLSTDGNVRLLANSFPLTQVGLKYVASRTLHFPFFFGAGARKVDDGPGDDEDIWGLDFGFGIEMHFSIWRRISPYVGGVVSFGFVNSDGGLTGGVGLGPVLGVEYFIADRVSLSAQYGLTLQFVTFQGGDQSTLQFGTLANGAATLTFYF